MVSKEFLDQLMDKKLEESRQSVANVACYLVDYVLAMTRGRKQMEANPLYCRTIDKLRELARSSPAAQQPKPIDGPKELEFKIQQLGVLFSELSEFYWSAEWASQLDIRLWLWLQNPSSPLLPHHRKELARLSQETGKWFWWPEDKPYDDNSDDDDYPEEPIDIDEWKKIRADSIVSFKRKLSAIRRRDARDIKRRL